MCSALFFSSTFFLQWAVGMNQLAHAPSYMNTIHAGLFHIPQLKYPGDSQGMMADTSSLSSWLPGILGHYSALLQVLPRHVKSVILQVDVAVFYYFAPIMDIGCGVLEQAHIGS